MVRTLSAAAGVDAGFETEGAMASYVSTSSVGTPVDERHQFFQDLIRHFEALPWVTAATVSENAPLSPHADVDIGVQGRPEPLSAQRSKVMIGYFEALDLSIAEGRTFQPGDTVGAEPVAVVSPALARAAFGDVDVIGRELVVPGNPGESPVPVRIVGVTGEARVESLLGAPESILYLPLEQHYSAPGNAVVLRTRPGPAASVAAIEQELRAVDPRIAIVNIQPYSDVVDGTVYVERMNAELFSIVGILAAVLAAAGIFAMVSLSVGRRAPELAVRRALGAEGGNIVRLVTGRVFRAVAVGLMVGLAACLWVTPILEGLLYEVEPLDPAAFLVGVALLMLATLLATWRPALRAIRVDPAEALRADG